jgi:hypothetical protein
LGRCRARERRIADRKRDQHQIARHGYEGDPRQLLISARRAQAVQRNLGQPRVKLASTGDQQAEGALLPKAASKSSGSLNTDLTLTGICKSLITRDGGVLPAFH